MITYRYPHGVEHRSHPAASPTPKVGDVIEIGLRRWEVMDVATSVNGKLTVELRPSFEMPDRAG